MNHPHPFELLVGCDRSDSKLDLCLIDTRTSACTTQCLSSAPEALQAWAAELRLRYPDARVAFIVEQPARNLVSFFEAYAWIQLYPINPLTLLRFRQAFVTSCAKDDLVDARYLAELLLHHLDKLQAWTPDTPTTRMLQYLTQQRRALVDERTALTNRLQAYLKDYFPQAIELLGPEFWRPFALALLLKWPTLQTLKKVPEAKLRAFFFLHGSRSAELVNQRLVLLAKAVPLSDDPALLASHSLIVKSICRSIESLTQGIEQHDEALATAFAEHPDRALFAELPGAGAVLAPRLLAAMGSLREQFPTAVALQCASGIAPVTQRSGKSRKVHRRYRCPMFMRQAFHEFARASIRYCRWAAAFVAMQREAGKSFHTAVRALAYKWQRILWKCWQSRSAYSDALYEAALQRKGSPLHARLAAMPLGVRENLPAGKA